MKKQSCIKNNNILKKNNVFLLKSIGNLEIFNAQCTPQTLDCFRWTLNWFGEASQEMWDFRSGDANVLVLMDMQHACTSTGRLSSVRCSPIFVVSQYGTCFVNLLAPRILRWLPPFLERSCVSLFWYTSNDVRLEAAQIKFLRHLLGITKLDKEKNRCIRKKTGAQTIVKEIKQYQRNWLQHVQRMDTNRLPK